MIIMVSNRYFIHPEAIGSVTDNRTKPDDNTVRVYTNEGLCTNVFEKDEADQFMGQYLMFANNRNRQFELGYGQTLAYYSQMEAHTKAHRDAASPDTLEGWLAPGTDKGQ